MQFDSVSDWQIWIIAAALLLVAEMFTTGFWLACVAIGALVASVVALLPVGLVTQVIVFAGASVASLLGLRPALAHRFLHPPGSVRTNVDALLGKTGIVTAAFDPVTRLGRVSVEGEDWRGALLEGQQALPPGARVIVVQVDGSTVVVEQEAAP